MKPQQMEKESAGLTQERQAWRGRVLTRWNRYRSQLVARWWVLLLGIAIGLSAQTVRSRLELPRYLSSGRMMVNLKLTIPEGSLYTEELNNFLGTQAALMQSPAVMERAHERVAERLPDLEAQNVALKAVILPRTTIFVLEGSGSHPGYTRTFVQACMEEYINLKKEMRAQTSDTTLAGMTEEVERLEKELRQCDAELVAFSSSNSVLLLQEQGNSAASYAAALTQRLAALKSEYGLLGTLDPDQALQRRDPGLPAGAWLTMAAPEARAEPATLVDADYMQAQQQLLVLRAEQEDLKQYLRPKHPRMLGLSEEINRRERLLTIFRQQSAEQLERRKVSLRSQIANLEREVKEWDGRALEMSRRGAELQRLKANNQRIQALYDRLLATMQSLDVNKQISPESVTIMEKASPAIADRAGLPLRLLLGAAAGLGAGLLVLLLVDRLDDRIGSLSELQELFSEDVLVQIPREKSALRKGEPGLLHPHDERYAFVEAYRSLRSSLLFMTGSGERPRTLLVTSSVPNEGKSLTSANLAITLASAGAQVLLVDADLRKGSLHHRFGLDVAVPGLSEALLSQANPDPRTDRPASQTIPWRQAVQSTRFPNLFLLPRGETTHRSTELFVHPVAVQLLEQAAARYDFIVLDTAPVMAADDVTSLAPHVDGVIFVVRAGQSSARVARAALDLLYLRHVRVLGLVFNAVRPTSADYYYYYQYKDYHGSYPRA